jgi:eukaryotic-like serine/threonine-protein kinase
LRRRMEILIDVFEAVEDAHRHLVVHADLKPENILVTAEGKPRLLDFGVAMMLSELGVSEASRPEANGGSYTAVFASPEQRAGERLTVTSDIYSLGVIAQLVLTGLRPSPLPVGVLHSGATRPGTIKKLRDLDRNALASAAEARATTPRALMAAIQGDVEAILDKALRVDAKERFQSVQEMREEFWRVIYGYPIRTRPAGRLTRIYKWALRNRLAAALGVVLMLAVLFSIAGVVLQATEAARKRQIAQTRLHELVRLTDVLAGDLYESVHGLEGSEAAQAALLASAHQTVDKLAADDSGDAQLNLELAQEYEKLTKLDLSQKPPTPQNAKQFNDDLDKEIGILNRLKANDPEARRIRERLPRRMQSAK